MNERQWTAPTIVSGHIDGPMLTYSDGQMHWLTLRERLAVAFGRANAASIQAKRRPDLANGPATQAGTKRSGVKT